MSQYHFPQHRRFIFPNRETNQLFETVLKLKNLEDCEMFFRDLCTIQELRSMSERWQIAQMIWQGMPYRVITNKTGASSATIARVAYWLTYGEGGFEKACTELPEHKINLIP